MRLESLCPCHQHIAWRARSQGELPLVTRTAPHVEDRAPPTSRTDEPLPAPRIAQSERPTTYRARRHRHVTPRAHRHFAARERVADAGLLRGVVLRTIGHRPPEMSVAPLPPSQLQHSAASTAMDPRWPRSLLAARDHARWPNGTVTTRSGCASRPRLAQRYPTRTQPAATRCARRTTDAPASPPRRQ